MRSRARLAYGWNARIVGPAALRARRLLTERRGAGAARHDLRHLAPPLKVSARTKELVSRHWLEGRHANGVRKVAWVTSGAPVELLKALGFYVLYPENHAAICGTARRGVELAMQAEAAGYSRDLCSYARNDIGTVLSGRTPVGRLPRPDLLFACTNICQTVLSWYRVLARHFQAPLVLIETPFLYYDEALEHSFAYVRRQLEEAIPFLETIAGTSLDMRELRRVGASSRAAAQLWMEILERNRHVPAPITAIDQFIQMAPIVELRGDAATVDLYALLLQEVDERIARGIGAVREERRRLLWDNLPIWYRLRYLSQMLAGRGAALVASTYTNAWGELAGMIDPDDPFGSMARTYLYPILNRSTGHKLKTMRRMRSEYRLDGVILHSDRSCKPYSIGQIDQRDRLVREDGVPALMLEADHNDFRCYAEEQSAGRLEAFLERLGI